MVSLPEKLATGRHCGTSATLIATCEPGASLDPGAGDWLVTVPAGTPGATTCEVRTLSPTRLRADCASVLESPANCGTFTGRGPRLSTTPIVEPSVSRVPGRGCWAITVPLRALL